MKPLGAAASAFALLTIVAQVIRGIKATTGGIKDRKRLREEVRWRETLTALEATGGPLGRLHVILAELLGKLQAETGVKKTIAALKWPFKESQIKDAIIAIEREKALLHLALSKNSRKLLQEIKLTTKTNQQTLDHLVASFAEESMNHTARLDDIQDHLGSMRLTQETTTEDKRRDEILRWLSPLDHSAQQSDFIRRRESGTGRWLLESNEYETWVKATDQTIFCPGIPGAGKTILTSVIIEDLFNRSRDDPDMAAAFLYCNFNRQMEQTIEDILGSIARRLLQQIRTVPPTLADLYKSHGSRRKPSLGEICSALETAAQLCLRAIVVVDALDECQRSTRSHLLKHIFEIQSTHGISIFMTSRFIPEITEQFVQKTTIEIKAHESDLRLHLDSRMFSLPACVLRNPDLQQDIKTAIIKATDGMFLLAQLHMQSLEGKRSPRAIKTALEQLPSGTDAYDFAYNDAMLRIKSQHPDQAQLARQVLQWVTRSSRELRAQELQTALAIKTGDRDLDIDDIPELEDMLSACLGLVTVVEESNIVRLVHYMTQEYFDRTWNRWFPNAEKEMGVACITYLLFEKMRSSVCMPYPYDESIFHKMLDDHPFYRHAASQWVYYARDIEKPWPELEEFLQCPEAFQNVSKFLFGIEGADTGSEFGVLSLEFPNFDQVTDIHLLAHVGLLNVFRETFTHRLDIDVDARDNWGMTPLMHAAHRGDLPMVVYLLEHGADPALHNVGKSTALGLACSVGRPDVMDALLQKDDTGIDAHDSSGDTPLIAAARGGFLEVAERLLATGKVNANAYNLSGETPLSLAVDRRNLDMCRTLLDKGHADINLMAGTYWSRTVLMMAVSDKSLPIAKLLLEYDVIQVNVRDSKGKTALHMAVDRGSAEMTRLLIEFGGADVTARDENGLTPLLTFFSSSWVNPHVAEALLSDKGIEPDARDPMGRTAFSLATCWTNYSDEHLQIMNMLASMDQVDVNSRDNDGRTPLHHAVRDENILAVERILQCTGVRPDDPDYDGISPLNALIYREVAVACDTPRAPKLGSEPLPKEVITLVRQHLSFTAILMMRFETPASRVLELLEASESEYATLAESAEEAAKTLDQMEAASLEWDATELIKLRDSCSDLRLVARRLLEATGTDFGIRYKNLDERGGITVSDQDERLALVVACEFGAQPDMVVELIRLGAAINARDDRGISPLSSAVIEGLVEVVPLLLAAGADPSIRDHLGRTALGCINGKTGPLIVQLLLEHGADVHTRDLRGKTPLMLVVSGKDSIDVAMLLLEEGARVKDRDEDGHDAIWYARKGRPSENRRQLIEILEQRLEGAAGDEV